MKIEVFQGKTETTSENPKRGILLVFCMAVLAALATNGWADTQWTGPGDGVLDGDWATESNWDNGLPNATGKALLDNLGVSYTVSLTNEAAQVVKGLTLTGTSGAVQPLLNVDGALVSDGENVSVTQGRITVNEGGTLELRNGGASIKANANSSGGLLISGGKLIATNGFTSISVSAGNAWGDRFARFCMTGGAAKLKLANSKTGFSLSADKSYQMFDMSGGKIEVEGVTKQSMYAVQTMGYGDTSESFKMSGDAEFVIRNAGVKFGWGTGSIGGNAKLTMTCDDAESLQFGPIYSDSGKATTFDLKDNSQVMVSSVGSVYLGHSFSRSVTRSTLNISGGTHSFGRYSVMGSGTGTYTVNITGGHTTFAQYGVRVASVPNISVTRGTPAYFVNTTTVNVTSGVLYTKCNESQNASARKYFWGFVIGNGTDVAAGDWFDGRVNLSGSGIITNGAAPVIVGVGHAAGSITQTGGFFRHETGSSRTETCALVIGSFGGKGTYALSAGGYLGENNVHIGGTTLERLDRTAAAPLIPSGSEKTAEGTLSVTGTGSFETTQNMRVGYDGTGTINLADSGSIKVGGTLTLSNAVSSAVNIAVTGVTPPIFTAKKLVVADGAKLKVDVSGFTGGPGRYELISCTSRTGSFAADDIELVGDTQGGKIEQGHGSSSSIYYTIPKGMFLLLR